jgi:hypothetical protein
LEKRQSIISYLLTFLLILILLRIIGIINLNNIELLSYLLIFFGLSYTFNSFGKNRRGLLFISTVLFLIGLVFFIISNFEIQQMSKIIVPSSLMIIGIGLFMTYLDGNHVIFVFILSLLLIVSGIIITITHGEITISSFFSSCIGITEKYWAVLLIFLGVFLLFRKEKI